MVENSFKKCVFFHFLNNKCIIFFSFLQKNDYHMKKETIL
jgi:hypothetical protein